MTAAYSMMRPRRGLSLLCIIACLFYSIIVAIWYGVNSDRDYIHPLLTQLIPAGHCACQTSTTFQCSTCLSCPEPALQLPTTPTWNFEYPRDARNDALEQTQCKVAFPGLFEDVARGKRHWRSQGGLVTEDLDAIQLRSGMARAFISQGNLHVVAARSMGDDHRKKILGVLSSIHRALVADRDRADQRDIEFVFSVEDKVEDVTNSERPVWVFARTPTEEGVWLMPDFSFWAWDNPTNYIGPYDQVVDRIQRLDVPWNEKKPQLVWRGKPSFSPKLRRALIEAARDKPWGDVKQVQWSTGANVLKMEDHCRYMFIAHVEGRSYSASLKYRQACNSVIVAHKLQYIQHHHYLLVSEGPQQNYVEVERDFSDLAEKIEPLVENTAAAARIAQNSVKTFRERYLTPAAEACYWRQLFDGYSSVWNSTVNPWSIRHGRERGLRYESFLLLESPQQLEFRAETFSGYFS
ncbi:unnamed protein product [Penicillium pancosmium]